MSTYEFNLNVLDLKLITGVIGVPITLSTLVYVSYISYRKKHIATHYRLILLLLLLLVVDQEGVGSLHLSHACSLYLQ